MTNKKTILTHTIEQEGRDLKNRWREGMVQTYSYKKKNITFAFATTTAIAALCTASSGSLGAAFATLGLL